MSNSNYLIKNCDYEMACFIKGFSMQANFSVYFESDDDNLIRFNQNKLENPIIVDIEKIDWDNCRDLYIDIMVKEHRANPERFETVTLPIFRFVPLLFDNGFEENIIPCTWVPFKKSVSVTVLESEYVPEMTEYYDSIDVFKPGDLNIALTASDVIYTNFNDISYVGGLGLYKGIDSEKLSPTVVVGGVPNPKRFAWNCMVIEKGYHSFEEIADRVSFLRKYNYCYRDYLKNERNRSK